MKQYLLLSLTFVFATNIVCVNTIPQLMPENQYNAIALKESEIYKKLMTIDANRKTFHDIDSTGQLLHGTIIPIMNMFVAMCFMKKTNNNLVAYEKKHTRYSAEDLDYLRTQFELNFISSIGITCLISAMSHSVVFLMQEYRKKSAEKELKKHLTELKNLLQATTKKELEAIFSTLLTEDTFTPEYVGYEEHENVVVITTKEYRQPFFIPLLSISLN